MRSGQRIAKLRDKRCLTQGDLAEKIGISRASLSHYETNRRKPDYSTLEKIADYFNVSSDYLLGRTDELFENVELTDRKIVEKCTITIDGQQLTDKEVNSLIAYIRLERMMKK